MNGLEIGINRRAREEAALAQKRARDWAARATAAERGPAPFVLAPGASVLQAATWRVATAQIASRERQSKVQRGWVRLPKSVAPPGCIPVATLFGRSVAILIVDYAGLLRLSANGKAGAVVTVSEAALIASGRGAV